MYICTYLYMYECIYVYIDTYTYKCIYGHLSVYSFIKVNYYLMHSKLYVYDALDIL